jgi:hypothetical protein
MCHLGYATMYGWKWDHDNQEATSLTAIKTRQSCIINHEQLNHLNDDEKHHGMLMYPVKEQWMIGGEIMYDGQPGGKIASSDVRLEECGLKHKHEKVIDTTQWLRTVS